MSKRLIINADDYGLTAGCDRAIQTAMDAGAVSSASCLVWPNRAHTHLVGPCGGECAMGVHLRLTGGPPISPADSVSSLVNESGSFPSRPLAVFMHRLEPEQVRLEWTAQIDEFLRFNRMPTHLDSHHHVHGLVGLWDVYADLCVRYEAAGVPLSDEQRTQLRGRGVQCADFAEVRWTDGTLPTLLLLLAGDFDHCDTVHLMTHPGLNDPDLRACSSMTAAREAEAHVLTLPAFRGWLAARSIETVGYAEI